MPRPIHVPADQPGISRYTLSAHEEWALLAVTFSISPLVGAGGDDFAYLDMRDPAGGIIYMQPLTTDDGGPMFYSLSTGASEWSTNNDVKPFWPQELSNAASSYVSQRLSPLTLYTGCTVNVYKPTGGVVPPADPITSLSTFYTIPDLHLWVEDTGRVDYIPPKPPPPILVHAPELV